MQTHQQQYLRHYNKIEKQKINASQTQKQNPSQQALNNSIN